MDDKSTAPRLKPFIDEIVDTDSYLRSRFIHIARAEDIDTVTQLAALIAIADGVQRIAQAMEDRAEAIDVQPDND